jgi:hypothetical protein
MKCLSVEQIYLYLEKELPSLGSDQIKKHLESCPKCRSAVDERMKMLQAVSSLSDFEVPPDFAQQVMERIYTKKVSLFSWLGAIAAGFFLSAFAGLAYLIISGQSLSRIFIQMNFLVLNIISTITMLWVKLLKFAAITSALIRKFFSYILTPLTHFTSIISPEIQIIVITVFLFFLILLAYGLRKKILIGEKT